MLTTSKVEGCSGKQAEQEEAERHQKGKYAKKGIDTLRDNFYLKRTDLLEKAN